MDTKKNMVCLRRSRPYDGWMRFRPPLLAVLLASAPARGAVTLDDAWTAALANNEAVATAREQVLQAREHVRQAGGAVLPSVSGVASYLVQDKVTGALGQSIAPATQPFAKLTATQPLFRGLREFAALRAARTLATAQEEAARQVEAQLYGDLAQGFYAVLAAEADIAALTTELDAYAGRIDELEARVKTGRSRASEVLAARAARAALDAQVAAARGALATTRETFAFLTGLDPATALADAEPAPAATDALPAWLPRLADRPDVKAAGLRAAAATEGVAVARGAYWPSLDLIGNYYLKRTGVLEDVRWDAQVALTVPLFTGGVTASRVREAASVSRAADQDLHRTRRGAEEDLRAAWDRVQADRLQADALANAADAAEKNYHEQDREYRLGLVTNLDVLQALSASQEAARALARARFTLKADIIKLDTAAGRRPVARQGATPS